MKARGLLVLGLVVTAALARADLVFSNIEATVTFDNQTTFDLDVDQNGHEIDFTAGSVPIFLSSESEFTTAFVEISYDASTTGETINQLDLIFSGWTMGGGAIRYSETVFDSEDNQVARVEGLIDGDMPFVQSDTLTFDGLTEYSVVKNFTLVLGGIEEGPSIASMGIVEQNAVPEPATMGALAIGALGLLARRRRK